LLSVHITGYQWGWRYAYPDSFYYKILSNPVNVGSNIDIGVNGSIYSKMHYNTDKFEKGILKSINKSLILVEYTGDEVADYNNYITLMYEFIQDKLGESAARDPMLQARANYMALAEWDYNLIKNKQESFTAEELLANKPAKVTEMLTEMYFCRR
jgi:heme/copper-type cytochrome/quinol oxidase subunit 2